MESVNKIYYIERRDEWGYDEYDSCVVIAESEDRALEEASGLSGSFLTGKIEFVGIANKEQETGVLLGSFNAG